MAIDFKESKTRENLMRAFAGESQARNRYTIAAEKALNQKMFAVNQIFLFTADQEKAHAERFYDLLQSLSGTSIEIDGSYPVDNFEDVTKLLRAAQHNEMEEFDDVSPTFAEVARGDGILDVAAAFHQIAEIEKVHGKRFGLLADLIEHNLYFESEAETAWMCLNCGYIHYGKMVPMLCPVCKYDRGYFIPARLAPYLDVEVIGR